MQVQRRSRHKDPKSACFRDYLAHHYRPCYRGCSCVLQCFRLLRLCLWNNCGTPSATLLSEFFTRQYASRRESLTCRLRSQLNWRSRHPIIVVFHALLHLVSGKTSHELSSQLEDNKTHATLKADKAAYSRGGDRQHGQQHPHHGT